MLILARCKLEAIAIALGWRCVYVGFVIGAALTRLVAWVAS